MKKVYKIPVTWQMMGVAYVEAESMEEAIRIFDEETIDEALPWDDAEYVAESYDREHQPGMSDEKYYRIYNPEITPEESDEPAKNTCTCKFCGCEFLWDEGNVWICDECNETFCTRCFVDAFDWDEYDKMLNIENGNPILCPKCWKKHKLNGGK